MLIAFLLLFVGALDTWNYDEDSAFGTFSHQFVKPNKYLNRDLAERRIKEARESYQASEGPFFNIFGLECWLELKLILNRNFHAKNISHSLFFFCSFFCFNWEHRNHTYRIPRPRNEKLIHFSVATSDSIEYLGTFPSLIYLAMRTKRMIELRLKRSYDCNFQRILLEPYAAAHSLLQPTNVVLSLSHFHFYCRPDKNWTRRVDCASRFHLHAFPFISSTCLHSTRSSRNDIISSDDRCDFNRTPDKRKHFSVSRVYARN